MTVPDEGLEEVLRRALSAAAEQVEPGEHGLDRIQARTRATPIPSLPVSLAMAAVGRVRHWTWRGHWAWQDPAYWRDSAMARRAASLLEDLTRLMILSGLRGLTGLICLRDLIGLTGVMVLTGLKDLTSLGDLTGSKELSSLKRLLTSLKGSVHRLSRMPSLRLAFQTRALAALSTTAGLAMVVFVTATAMAVPPLRSVLVQVSSSVLTGGNDVIQPGITATGPGGGSPASVGRNRISSRSGSAGLAGAAPGRPGTSPSQVPCAVSPRPTSSPSATRTPATAVANPSGPSGAQATSVPGTPGVAPSEIAHTSASPSATCSTPAPTSSPTGSPAPTPAASPSTPTPSPTTPATSTAPATSPSPTTPDTGSPSATPAVTSSAPPTTGNSSTGNDNTSTGGSCCDEQTTRMRVWPGLASGAGSGRGRRR